MLQAALEHGALGEKSTFGGGVVCLLMLQMNLSKWRSHRKRRRPAYIVKVDSGLSVEKKFYHRKNRQKIFIVK
jgi:hypothetical protein